MGDHFGGRRLIGATVGGLGRGSEVPPILFVVFRAWIVDLNAAGGKGRFGASFLAATFWYEPRRLFRLSLRSVFRLHRRHDLPPAGVTHA